MTRTRSRSARSRYAGARSGWSPTRLARREADMLMKASISQLAMESRANPRKSGSMIARLFRLVIGLLLYGFTMALMVQAGLGLDPWDVFHQGLTHLVPLTFGQVVIA